MRFNKHVVLFGLAGALALAVLGEQVAQATPNLNPASVPSRVRKGAAISAECAMCHGSNGISVAANIPNLAGQHYSYLLQQLHAFKDGKRDNPLMEEVAHSLSRRQMKDLSAYFASIPLKTGQSAGQG